jgi:hypothetical protein
MGPRVAALALMLGGVLVGLTYVFWTANGIAPDVLTAPPPSSPLGTLLVAGVGLGALLLTVGVPTLIARQQRQAGTLGDLGGWLVLVGFLVWAVSVLAGPSVVALPPWVLDADQVLLAIGSVLFGVATFDAGVLSGSAALLVAVTGLVGLLPTALPDLLSFALGGEVFTGPPALRIVGYVALVVFGLAWAWLGYAIWER